MKSGTDFIRFGIPSLDNLFSPRETEPQSYGIRLPGLAGSTSISLIGRTGTGKSLLGLHLASRYLADASANALEGEVSPIVFYVSTDLSFARASDTWRDFGLDSPNKRTLPFDEHSAFSGRNDLIDLRLKLKSCRFGEGDIAEAFLRENRRLHLQNALPVCFIDLSSSTAGDEWGFLLRLISSLQCSSSTTNRHIKHLVVIDAVEGLETFSGRVDPFGHAHNHRSRIAQVLRTAINKCHLAFVLEDARVEPCAEEYVTDVVVRLSSNEIDGYLRRSLEVVKSRGSTHVRGHHYYYIRDGTGIGDSVPDDPGNASDISSALRQSESRDFAYFHVVHSLHWLTRMRMQGGNTEINSAGNEIKSSTKCQQTAGRPITLADIATMDSPKLPRTLPNNGLLRGQVTALTGDEATYKSRFGRAFLSGCFRRPVRPDSARASELKQKTPFQNQPRTREAAVYITTHNLTKKQFLSRLPWHWHTTGKDNPIAIFANGDGEPIDSNLVVFRQLEAHNLNSSMLFNIIRRCVEDALERLGDTVDRVRWWKPSRSAPNVRIVIDDWATIKNSYPQVESDSLFLPFLIRYFEEKGVTVLIIETSPGRPDQIFDSATDRSLRSLVGNHIFTWHVPFYGEDRVAIAAIPPILDGLPSVVAELRTPPSYALRDDEINERLWADPHFELYEGLDSRAPKPVSLEVQLFASAEGFKRYQNQANAVLNKVFTSHNANGVILGFEPEQYTALRNYTQIIGDVRSPFTTVIQVDEYWQPNSRVKQMRPTAPNEKVHFTGTEPYVEQPVTDDSGKPHSIHDPYRQFQFESTIDFVDSGNDPAKGLDHRFFRWQFFDPNLHYGEDWQASMGKFGLIPYLWDFGFLLFGKHAWDAARAVSKSDSEIVENVWNYCTRTKQLDAQIGWRDFFQASRIVSDSQPTTKERKIVPFDMDMLSPQTLPCLVFEVWASEIEEAESPFKNTRHCAKRALLTLPELLHSYKSEFYRVWLLLGEVLHPSLLLGDDGYLVNRVASNKVAAARHWYSTAAQAQKSSEAELLIPGRLPGRYCARGDWFLTVTSDSRSNPLGERAMDLLSRRRDNVLRMELGIGLPVRDLIWAGATGKVDTTKLPIRYPSLRTCLATSEGDLTKLMTYMEFCDLGANKMMQWFWRSQILNYHRHDRIWERWMARFIVKAVEWNEKLRRQGLNGFDAYDCMRHSRKDRKYFQLLREYRIEFDGMITSLREILCRIAPISSRLKKDEQVQ